MPVRLYNFEYLEIKSIATILYFYGWSVVGEMHLKYKLYL